MKTKFYFLFVSFLFLTLFSTANAATYVVDRLDDLAGATACTAAANDCSLRGAIINANANGAGADTIQFNVGGGNAQTIIISSTPLPDIQTSLTIDGTTQPLWGSAPIVEINGAASIANMNGFRVTSPLSNVPITVTIKGLIINRFQGSGIFFNASSGITATVSGCYIGTSAGGGTDLGNGNDGIRISAYLDSSFTIGGFSSNSERNVISGNQGNGINVDNVLMFVNGNTDVFVYNNFIGTSSAGNTDIGNSGDGIRFGGQGFGNSLYVGLGSASGRNIISGNDGNGIWANSNSVTIYGNHIGTSLNGNVDLGNTLNGIKLQDNVSNAIIGGTLLGINAGNLISGNNENGISINNASISATIQRNLIGTNAAGTSALGNGTNGIFLSESNTYTTSSILVGSSENIENGNTISGNSDGIRINERVNGVKIYGNRIGLNATANGAIPNLFAGLRILSADNEIGLADNNIASNAISGNSDFGMMLVGLDSTNNKIYNNYIGTNASGNNFGNGQDGIYINQGAANNKIGTGTNGGANKIAFNSADGINVADGQNNAIRANSIYSNGNLGIDLDSDDVTPNDPGDNDSGANSQQNFPVIQRVTPTRITGFIDSIANVQFAIDFYRVDSCDASGFGEGRVFLGSQTVLTNSATGIGTISFPTALTVGQIITATATRTANGAGDTSEFSQCVTVTGEPGNLSFSAANYTVNESSATRTIVVNRNGGTTGTISVNYTTFNGTATAGQDYTGQSGTLTFLNGEVVKSFDVAINNDIFDENDEVINLFLSEPSPGVFITPNQTASLTILDNDATPTISFTDVSQDEGNLGDTIQFSFRIQLSAPSELPISVDFTTANGTANGGVDFIHMNGTVDFTAYETLKNVLVTVNGDTTPEINETFFVNLSNPINAVFGDDQALGTILDDDNPGKFSFSFAPYSGTEHDSVEITVSRTNGTAGTVSIDYATNGGTALPFTDYTPVSGTLIFSDGETEKTFNVSLAEDQTSEPVETINLILSNPNGGTTIGNPSGAVLNIIDNDNGTLLNLAGEVVSAVDHSPIPNVTMTLQGSQIATTTTDSSGRYSFGNLAPNSNYSVTPSALGYTFSPISQQFTNLSADNLNVNFNATAAPSRQMRIIGGNVTPGQNVNATIELVAQGDENSVGFSLNFDQNILSNPQVSLGADSLNATLFVNNSQNGKLGILLGMPAGQTFPIGTRSLVTITFNTASTSAHSSPITFGDVPLAREIANVNADELTANYLDGGVTFAQGYEADLAPRPTGSGNGSVTVADFTQVGRFVSGIDTLNPNFNEFQRADCAPRISLGNGSITVADFTQAGRYASGLDTVNPAGGAAIPGFASVFVDAKDKSNLLFVPTVVRVANSTASAGSQIIVSILADAQGTENGFGFTLNFDPSKLENPLITKGADTQNATLIPNTTQTGKAAVVLAMPFGQAIPAGTRQLVTVRFDVKSNAPSGLTPLIFGDSPAFREVSDVDANVLDSSFQDGALNILTPTASSVSVSGRVLDKNGNAVVNAKVFAVGNSGTSRSISTNSFGFYRFSEINTGETYTFGVKHKNLQFAPQIISVFEAIGDLNFTSNSSDLR